MLGGFFPAAVNKKGWAFLAWEQRADLPVLVLLRSRISRSVLGRCTKVPVSAKGFRKQLQQRDLLCESAVSGRSLQGLSPSFLTALTLAVIHLVTALGRCHGVVWLCWQVGTDAIARSPLPPTSRPHVKCCFFQSEPKIICTRPVIIFCFVEVGLTLLSTHYTDISEGFWDLCNFQLPCFHSVIMVDTNSACSWELIRTFFYCHVWSHLEMMTSIYVTTHSSGAFVWGKSHWNVADNSEEGC